MAVPAVPAASLVEAKLSAAMAVTAESAVTVVRSPATVARAATAA
jgi:hypothetical protein